MRFRKNHSRNRRIRHLRQTIARCVWFKNLLIQVVTTADATA